MTIATPNIIPASVLVASGRPQWLDTWSRFAAATQFTDLPADIVARAKLVLLDCIGAIAAGMQEPELQAFLARLAARDGTGRGGVVIGGGERITLPAAAMLNGTAGTTLELDEGNQYARGHPGIHVMPAALATADHLRKSGADLLLALVLGYEIGARIGIASKLRVTMHPHGTWGTVGAAVATARLHEATPAQLIEAINVSASLALATSRRTMLEGGTVRNTYAGFSNQLGLTAWDLVCAEFTGESDGVGTVYDSIIADQFRPDEMVAQLGERWEIARNYFKRHAACRYAHGALDALAEISAREGGKLDPAAIERIELDTYVWAAQLDWAEPRNMLSAKFSLPFALATAIVNGIADVKAFRDSARANETARDLAKRVSVREDPSLTAKLPGLRPAKLRITLKDGRMLAAEAWTNKGDAEDPYSETEVREKFAEMSEPVWGASHARMIASAVDAIENTAGLRALMSLLAKPPRALQPAQDQAVP